MSKKYAIVTGASTGIGRAISIELGKNNYHVGLVARTNSRLQETKTLMEKTGGSADIYIVDLSKITSVNDFIKQILKTRNKIDALVNVAGIWHGKDRAYSDIDFSRYPQPVITDTYMVGTISPSMLAHGFIPLMHKKSKIINISGTFENGAKGWLPYFVSKRAIEDLTVGLAEELKSKDIQVNCISPSDTATQEYRKYFPQYIKDAIDPQKIASYAAYLCSESDGDITGKVFVIKKGQKPFEGFHA